MEKILILVLGMVLAFGGGKNQEKTDDEVPWERVESGLIVYYFAEHEERMDEPLVILLHGLGGTYRDMTISAKAFYEAGYAVAAFDLYGNGFQVYDYNIYLNEMLEGTKTQVEMVVGAIQEKTVCDTSKLTLYGTSLGGLAAFYEAAFGRAEPTAIVTVASCPDLKDTFARTWYYIPTRKLAGEAGLSYVTEEEYQALDQWTDTHNPYDMTEKLAKSAIFMVNGTQDQYMSIDRVRVFKRNMESAGGRIQVYENEGGKHDAIGDYRGAEMLQFLSEIFME